MLTYSRSHVTNRKLPLICLILTAQVPSMFILNSLNCFSSCRSMLEDHNTKYIDVIAKTTFKNEDHNAKYIEVIAKTIFKNGSILPLLECQNCTTYAVSSEWLLSSLYLSESPFLLRVKQYCAIWMQQVFFLIHSCMLVSLGLFGITFLQIFILKLL